MADLAPCGTLAAHKRHGRRGEVPCEACKRARRDYMRGLRARHRRERQGVEVSGLEGADVAGLEDAPRLEVLRAQRAIVWAALIAAVEAGELRLVPGLSRELREVLAELEECEERSAVVDPLEAVFLNLPVSVPGGE